MTKPRPNRDTRAEPLTKLDCLHLCYADNERATRSQVFTVAEAERMFSERRDEIVAMLDDPNTWRASIAASIVERYTR